MMNTLTCTGVLYNYSLSLTCVQLVLHHHQVESSVDKRQANDQLYRCDFSPKMRRRIILIIM